MSNTQLGISWRGDTAGLAQFVQASTGQFAALGDQLKALNTQMATSRLGLAPGSINSSNADMGRTPGLYQESAMQLDKYNMS